MVVGTIVDMAVDMVGHGSNVVVVDLFGMPVAYLRSHKQQDQSYVIRITTTNWNITKYATSLAPH